MRLKSLLLSPITLFFLFSCDDMHDVKNNASIDNIPIGIEKILVLCEGIFNMNNSTLVMLDMKNDSLPDKHYFQTVNNRKLGDTANDMKIYGGKIYIVVNVSGQVEIIDKNSGQSLKRIPIFNENNINRQPRFIDFYGSKAYVTCFDGNLIRIDTLSMGIDGVVKCGRNPEGICISNGKIYVANSGGLDFSNPDTTVSVIEIKNLKEIKKIRVAKNPCILQTDSEGDIYLASRGDNTVESYRFQKIDTRIDELTATFEGIHILNFTISEDKAYMYTYNFATQENGIKVFDCNTDKIISENFIMDGTLLTAPYSIQVDNKNGDVYVADAQNFVVAGDVICFDKYGKQKFKINQIGLNPNKIALIN
ncbi:MAG: YncE family protein [Paludibacteraceae bacterium]